MLAGSRQHQAHARSPRSQAAGPFTSQRPKRQRKSIVVMAQQGADTSKRVVICGGGIIGASTAYFLAQQGIGATVVERECLAAAASGKAGGFLAKDWNDSSPVGPLARRSYALHAELAKRFGASSIGYREVDTLQVVGSAKPVRSKATNTPSWLDGNVSRCTQMADKSTTAQVHPAKLTQALMSAAQQAAGAQLVIGTVTGISTAAGAVTGVRVQQQQQQQGQGEAAAGGSSSEVELPADAIVLCMGPWSSTARAWLPTAPEISGQKYHSIVLRPQQPVGDACIFTAFKTADGRSIEPEVYPRPDGTVYVCGEQDAVPVPEGGPAAVNVVPKSVQVLKDVASSLVTSLSGAAVEAEQACYLPLSADGLPVIGRLPDVAGVYVASGHSCWGILNGPATGEAVAQLITQGKSSLNLAAFDPARFVSRAAARRR